MHICGAAEALLKLQHGIVSSTMFHRRFSAPNTQQSDLLRAAQNMRVVMRENAGQSGAAERSIYPHYVRNQSILTASCVQKRTSSPMIAFYRGVLSF
jgi:hypothetical protein